MKKNVYNSVTLHCVMQEEDLKENECRTGIISMKENSFVFQENVPHRRSSRNPKLYDGKCVSMVRMKNGKYHFHLKKLDDIQILSKDFAFEIYCELQSAISTITTI